MSLDHQEEDLALKSPVKIRPEIRPETRLKYDLCTLTKNNTGCHLDFYENNRSIFPVFFKDTLKKHKDSIPLKLNKTQSISCYNSDVVSSQT